MTDTRTIERIRKLLALASNNSNEAEAAAAAAKAAEIMREHGLEAAAIDLAGGEGESREKGSAGAAGFRREKWSANLMGACAESCFVTCWTRTAGTKVVGFTLVGRRSGVASATVLYDYLSAVVVRLASKSGGSWSAFRFGCAERLAERIARRHRDELAAQRSAAETTQRTVPAGSNALVPVLEDYARKERELNRDAYQGDPPGTATQRRLQAEAAAREATAKMDELEAQGISWDHAWWMVNGGCETLEEAILREENLRTSSADARASDRRRGPRDYDAERRDHPDFRRGRRAAETVSLDRQLDEDKRRITSK